MLFSHLTSSVVAVDTYIMKNRIEFRESVKDLGVFKLITGTGKGSAPKRLLTGQHRSRPTCPQLMVFLEISAPPWMPSRTITTRYCKLWATVAMRGSVGQVPLPFVWCLQVHSFGTWTHRISAAIGFFCWVSSLLWRPPMLLPTGQNFFVHALVLMHSGPISIPCSSPSLEPSPCPPLAPQRFLMLLLGSSLMVSHLLRIALSPCLAHLPHFSPTGEPHTICSLRGGMDPAFDLICVLKKNRFLQSSVPGSVNALVHYHISQLSEVHLFPFTLLSFFFNTLLRLCIRTRLASIMSLKMNISAGFFSLRTMMGLWVSTHLLI